MIKRELSSKILKMAKQYPVVSIVGPRQSGKTTLSQSLFKRHKYVSLEDSDTRDFAINDPRGFLKECSNGVILDEIQRAPDLLSYIQTSVDSDDSPGRFILTGSQNLLISEHVSQTLAGRVAILNLLPFCLDEIIGLSVMPGDLDKLILKGFYPRLYDKTIDPEGWYKNYIQTYLERDVRSLKNVGDLNTFRAKQCRNQAAWRSSPTFSSHRHHRVWHWLAHALAAHCRIRCVASYG